MHQLRERSWWVDARTLGYRSLEHSPRGYCRYLRTRRPANTVVTPTTSIVLDGFPGSANSFAREAVLYSNPDASVASHIHTAAHVLEGLRLARPTVVLLRPPVDAITSYLSRGYRSEVEAALRAYERLHRRLLPHLDRLVVATFEQTTKQFGDVIDEVNTRFDTQLVPFPHGDPTARDAVFARLEAYTREVAGDAATLLQATPTDARKERQAEVRAVVLEPGFAELRRRCEDLYSYTRSATSRRPRTATLFGAAPVRGVRVPAAV